MPFAALWDWRRRVAELYVAVRESPHPRLAWQQWCQTREELFRHHPQSPIELEARTGYSGPQVLAYDPSLRFTVDLEPIAEPLRHGWPAGADGEVRMSGVARTKGLRRPLGAELVLYWIEGYGGGVFLPFRDLTSGHETFGGGRYLLDTIKGADLGCDRDGRIIVDFNFAYHPSCAYSDRWTCPLAPPENRLPFAIRAGERLPA